jgi:DNA mismatch repair protein MutS
MSTNTNSIYTQYFTYTNNNYVKYGTNTIVLLQVGAFFEVYGTKNTISNDITKSNIVEFANICQLNISEKSQKYDDEQIVMAGFRDYTIDKYLTKLTDRGYTVPVYIQEKNGGEISRRLDKVHSAGTYISCDTDSIPKISNHIMCIWFETHKPYNKSPGIKDTIVYGISVIDVFTGKSSFFQYETLFYMNVTTFDELERYISMFSPSELIIISPFDMKDINQICQYVRIQSNCIHYVDTRDNHITIKNCSTQTYMKHIIASFFDETTFDTCIEFNHQSLATQSFCYLLNFIQEHNPDLVRKITLPEFNNTSDRMRLANHTLLQLNIISENSKQNGKLSSVLSFLNRCCSPMGKRYQQTQLTTPTSNIEWLNKEYTMIDHMLDPNQYFMIDMFRKQLSGMRDLDKICRQLLTKSIYPSSIFQFYNSIQSILQINTCLAENNKICNYLCNRFIDMNSSQINGYTYIEQTCNNVIDFIHTHFMIQKCKNISSMTTFNENIIQPGVSDELDDAILQYTKYKQHFHEIHIQLNKMIQNHENTNNTTELEYVKIHETEKSGLSLQITSKRSKILEKAFGKSSITIEGYNPITISDIKFNKSSSANVDIDFKTLNEICKMILYYKNHLNTIITKTYLYVLDIFEKTYINELTNLSSYTAKIDVLQSKTYVARTLNYCKPTIGVKNDKSYINAHELRHCLIEHIQQNEIYVSNDVILGDSKCNGILLYGTNAVGKTSLIRALGVAVIMAQSGMYVPCTSFNYYPYTAIFSRIIGNDNLFKGLSTFAVEMSELRIILKMADENSLILGDELCSGTETESALSIFVAGLMNIHAKRSSFIFATHFHEIVNYDEIHKLTRLSMKHMSVIFDRANDCLIYDRKLKDGSGPSIYGLEVCKSLYLETDFLDLAYSIRNKYYPETQGTLSYKSSVYNSNKLRSLCELCKINMSEETHHILQQKDANSNGFIGTVHKNHKANLMVLCDKCHTSLHHTYDKVDITRKFTTNGYAIMEEEVV